METEHFSYRRFSEILRNCSVDEIKNAIKMAFSLPTEELKSMFRQIWEFARTNHTKEKFREKYKRAGLDILENNGNVLKVNEKIN